MGIYEDLGVTPLINAAGFKTRLGGAALPDYVIEAMAQAAQGTVDIAVLQARAGEIIAEVTGAESGYVTCGAAAALTLGHMIMGQKLDVRLRILIPAAENSVAGNAFHTSLPEPTS